MPQRPCHALRLVTMIGVASLPAMSVRAQTTRAAIERADSLFDAGAWGAAAAAYQAVVTSDSANGTAWFRLGYARHQLTQFPEAVEAWKSVDRVGFSAPVVRYNLGAAYARMHDTDEAFAWLEQSVRAGYGEVNRLRTDEDLASLRADPRFEALVTAADRNARPCMYDPVYAQFDFWVGEWEVRTPQGRFAGHNRIDKVTDGCLLLENWTAAGGSTGKSINYYDPVHHHWVQTWVDASGDVITMAGTLHDGAMRFEGEHRYRDGRLELFRMSFTPRPDGSVRQFIEQSRDGGDTWYVWFDGNYVKPNDGE